MGKGESEKTVLAARFPEMSMTDEILFRHGTTMVRRLRLAPGEAMPWHRDPFQRVAVVLGGDLLSIEYGDGGENQRVENRAGTG